MAEAAAATAPVAPTAPEPQAPTPAPVAPVPTDRIGGAVARAEAAGKAAAEAQPAKAPAPAANQNAAPPSEVPTDKPVEEPAKQKNDLETSLQNLRENRQLAQQRRALARERAQVAQDIEFAKQHRELRGSWKEKGPAAFLEGSGIPMREFGPAMIQYMLDNKAPPPPDPVAVKVQEAIRPMAEELEKERAERRLQQENMAKANWISRELRPHLDPDKHEALIEYAGGTDNALVFAFREIEKYNAQQSNPDWSPGFIANALEQIDSYFAAQLEQSVQKALKMKRMAKYAGAPAPATQSASGIAPTLSNNHNQSPSAASGTLQRRPQNLSTREDRVAAALAKYSLK